MVPGDFVGVTMSSLVRLITRETLIEIAGTAPGAKAALQRDITTQMALSLPDLAERFEVNTPLRLAHFISQTAHESDAFCTTREYASGAAYEGRKDLGNTQKGDGPRFPGRGVIQCTGRSNHRNFTSWMRTLIPDAPDFEANPSLLEEFPWALWSAIWFWSTRRLNVVADRDDAITVTRVINGGKTGLADRLAKLARAKAVLARLEASTLPAGANDRPILFRKVRDQDDAVMQLQILLRNAGFYHLSIDGDFGSGTEQAVRDFQLTTKLKSDGIVGRETWGMLIDWSAVRPL
jgi:putative chitinase